MQIPEPIMISKKPCKVRCPACSVTFNIASYQGGSGQDKLNKMVADYEAHFKNTHAKEDASQTAARILSFSIQTIGKSKLSLQTAKINN